MTSLQRIKLIGGPDHLPTEAQMEYPAEGNPYYIAGGPTRRHRYHWSGTDQDGVPIYEYMAEDYSNLGSF